MIPELKDWIERSVGFSDGLIHVNVGMGIFLALAYLLRERRHGATIAWTILLVLEVANELFDAAVGFDRGGRNIGVEALKDFIATLFWPTVLLFIYEPLRRRRRPAPD